MRRSTQILLMTALVLSSTVSTVAQEVFLNGPNTITRASSSQETSLDRVFSNGLAERLHSSARKNEPAYAYKSYDTEISEDLDVDSLALSALGAAGDTIKRIPLVEELADKVAGYSRFEYTKFRSEKRGKLYTLGKKASKKEERDYRWLLIFHQTSSFSVELKGSFWGSNLSARFGDDGFAVDFESKKLNDFIRVLTPFEDPSVHLGLDHDLEGSWFAECRLSF